MNGLETASNILFYHFSDKIPATTVRQGQLLHPRLSLTWFAWHRALISPHVTNITLNTKICGHNVHEEDFPTGVFAFLRFCLTFF